ncbi:MAG: type II CRISPR RNA-guided endonuclease Cas9, partial [Lachnospirales bacterium]
MNNEFFVGLDIGTQSVGYAVTNEKYEIVRKSGKSLWGVRVFEEAEKAVDRRGFRSNKRRKNRRNERILLLHDLFKDELNKVDSDFLQRIKESNFYSEDKSIVQKNSFFNDENYTDKDFFKEFPTVYHLRKHLISDDRKHDLRLYYLAISHILKHRGHFLFYVENVDNLPSFNDCFKSLVETYNNELEKDIVASEDIINQICVIVKDKISGSEKQKRILQLDGFNKKDIQLKNLFNLFLGLTCDFEKLFNLTFDGAEIKKISFKNDNFDDKREIIESVLGDRTVIIETGKALYDWSLLSNILKDEDYLSYAKVSVYENHKKQLKNLKDFYKEYFPKDLGYDLVFKEQDKKSNYTAYANKNAKREDFYKFLKSNFKEIKDKFKSESNDHEIDVKTKEIFEFIEKVEKEIENNSYLLKQKVTENATIPQQLNAKELEKMLKNASKHYTFLNDKDERGLNITDKILSIFKFRIPYYVGPLNAYHSDKGGNAWVSKKSNEKVYPWNFEEDIDVEKSAEKFITKMTNECSYLKECDVIPKDSLLYSKFMVLNEL